MNNPVGFYTSKLLKEKGFDEECRLCAEDGDNLLNYLKMKNNILSPFEYMSKKTLELSLLDAKAKVDEIKKNLVANLSNMSEKEKVEQTIKIELILITFRPGFLIYKNHSNQNTKIVDFMKFWAI